MKIINKLITLFMIGIVCLQADDTVPQYTEQGRNYESYSTPNSNAEADNQYSEEADITDSSGNQSNPSSTDNSYEFNSNSQTQSYRPPS